ncbi:MAG: DUF3164 family protein [Candidatus Cloacimonetes bacterium]|nr:DUF3164 family protein [Candidatus Cloacimonadota bacterium]
MAKIVKEGKHTYWIDGEGLKVPVKHVSVEDKLRDGVVTGLVERVMKLQGIIKSEKEAIEEEILKYLGEAAKRHGEEWVGGATLSSFSMEEEVVVKVQKRFTFDEKLQIAKTKIDQCIENWSGNANSKLVALVNRAFRVDQKGEVDTKQIMGLRTLAIDDQLWKEAMDLISDSMKVQSTKVYFYFRKANDTDGKLETIPLDFSSL